MPTADAHTDLSLVALFLNAHFIVKLVMLGLAGASIWSWAIIINKSIMLRAMKARMDEFEDTFWSGQSLDELYRSLTQKTSDGFAALSKKVCGLLLGESADD